ncbi:MAG: MarR family transcriptional regulator [Ferroplasma sp.]
MDKIINIWSLFDSVLNKYGERIHEELSGLDISMNEYKVLYIVHDKTVPMKYIAERLALAKGWITDIIDIMEAKGMVIRSRSVEDRRIINIEITEEGKKKYAEILSIIKNIIKKSLTGLNESEIKSLSDILLKIDNVLK